MPSLPSLAGGGPVKGVDGSDQTVWWILAGKRGAVGIGWESSDVYRGRHMYLYSQLQGGSTWRRVLNMLGTEEKKYIDTTSGDGKRKAKLVVEAYYQYCFLTQSKSGWKSGNDPAALNCVKKLWPNDPADNIIADFRLGNAVLTDTQVSSDAFAEF